MPRYYLVPIEADRGKRYQLLRATARFPDGLYGHVIGEGGERWAQEMRRRYDAGDPPVPTHGTHGLRWWQWGRKSFWIKMRAWSGLIPWE